MADPAMAAASAVAELTDEPLPGLPPTHIQWLRSRVSELEAEVAWRRRHTCPVIYAGASPAPAYRGAGW